MIAFLHGRLVGRGEDCLLLNVSGVGYRVFAPATVLDSLPNEGQEVLVHTYFHLREDQAQLYGFLSEEELEFFRLLLDVSGVGPKVGLGILSSFSVTELQRAIITEDIMALTRIPGIGRKTAQRLVIELRDKLLKKGIRPVRVNAGTENIQEDRPTGQSTTPPPSKKQVKGPTAIPALAKIKPRDDAFSALQALGYSMNEARDALIDVTAVVEPDANAEVWIKAALKYLASR